VTSGRQGSTRSRTLLAAAATIATITVAARIAGFLRTAVFGRAVGSGCVGVVYQTANTIPNIVFDIVAGGTLSALVVPLLAPALASGDRVAASRTTSALLTWCALVLSAISAVVIVFAGPLTRLLLGGGQCAGADELGRRMLVVFAPQILFYGLGIVLAGTLQAAERFAWPALAPLLSSVVVVAAYLVFQQLQPTTNSAASLPRRAELVLSLGTTAGVIVLAACQLPAALGLRLRLRPTLRFPSGGAALARRAALAGGLTLAAQQLATAVMLRLANGGISGTLVVLTIAQAVYLVPWAVLAVPVATALFPRLSAAWNDGERGDAANLARLGVQVVSALAAVGTVALVAAATPIADVLLDRHKAAHAVFGPAIAAFAVGLLGWSLVAILARILYAAHRAHLAAIGQALGWTVTVAVDIVLANCFAAHDRAVVLALGNAIGVSVAAAVLIAIAHRVGVIVGLRPVTASCLRAILAAAAGSAVGWGVSRLAPNTAIVTSIITGVAAAAAGVTMAAVLLALSDRELVGLLRRRGLLPQRRQA
jgi:putative peptidoglycan lipid II flippase